MIAKFIDYLAIEKRCAAHTCDSYKRHLTAFESYCRLELDTKGIAQVDYVQIRSWIVAMVEQGLTNRSINAKIAALRSFYKYLLKIKVCTTNPLTAHKPLKIARKRAIPFSEDEMSRIFEAVGDDFASIRDLTIIFLLYATGIRRAELMGLKESDIDFYTQQLKVLGKRNKERYVPLLPELIDYLKRYLFLKEQQGFLSPELFVTNKGKKIYENFVYRLVKSYLSRVSSKDKKSPHVIRHTFATQLIAKGADLNAVKELLGHSSLAATQVYVHTNLAQLKKSYNKAHPRGQKK